MTDLVLLVKASNPKQLRQVEDFLNAQLGELDLEIKVSSNPTSKWVHVSLNGEDQTIATNYINQKIGTCPVNSKNVNKGSVLKGYLAKTDMSKQQLTFDVGIFEPKVVYATVSVDYLQTHLTNGKKIPLNQICETFGFQAGLPLRIVITDFNEDGNELLAELAAEQLEQVDFWKRSLLDRLIILNASLGDIEVVLERTRLNRDIISVDELGMFEHALVCKLGTDAAGLVSKVGRYMRNAKFIVYNPRKIIGFIG